MAFARDCIKKCVPTAIGIFYFFSTPSKPPSGIIPPVKTEQVKAVLFVAVGAIAVIATAISYYLQRRAATEKGRKHVPRSAEPSQPHGVIDPRLCRYVKKNGEQCQHERKHGSIYCAVHARKELMRRIETAPRREVYEITPADME